MSMGKIAIFGFGIDIDHYLESWPGLEIDRVTHPIMKSGQGCKICISLVAQDRSCLCLLCSSQELYLAILEYT